MPKILLTSVFKPFGKNDSYGRVECIPELFHNQLTRYQGIYSPRQQIPSIGLHAIARNISHPCVVLDWPTLKRFETEIRKGYDYIGISSIVPNFSRVKKMVEIIRECSPRTKIILGGFCAAIEDVKTALDVDYVCIGDGITFIRDLLHEPSEFTFVNPDININTRYIMGIPIKMNRAIVITGLGCSYKCEFCAPAHFFGKRSIDLLPTGEAIFNEMLRLKRKFKTFEFSFIGDDNFFYNLQRVRDLHRLIKQSGEVFTIGIFASANLVKEFSPMELAELGIDWLWIGRESKYGKYRKNKDIDFHRLIPELKRWGISIVLSSILLMDNHTPENIWDDINDHIACGPTYSQFAHLSPSPGTKLWQRIDAEGRILKDIPYEEWHAFKQPWFQHPHFSLEEAEKIQREAYIKDFQLLGPSTVRRIDLSLDAYNTFMQSGNPLLKHRAKYLASQMSSNRIFLAAASNVAPNKQIKNQINTVREKLETFFGPMKKSEKIFAGVLTITARAWQARTGLLGDVIQPRTEITYYNGCSTP